MGPQFHFIVIIVLIGLVIGLEYYHLVRSEKNDTKKAADDNVPKKRWWMNDSKACGAILYSNDGDYAKVPASARFYASFSLLVCSGIAAVFYRFSPYPEPHLQQLLLAIGIVGLLPLLLAIFASARWGIPLKCSIQLLAAELRPGVIYTIICLCILFGIGGWIGLMLELF